MMRPVGDWILVRPVITTHYEGGLIAPESYHRLSARGTVVAVGSEQRRYRGIKKRAVCSPHEVKPGDDVELVPRDGPTLRQRIVEHEGVKYLEVRSDQVVGIWEDV